MWAASDRWIWVPLYCRSPGCWLPPVRTGSRRRGACADRRLDRGLRSDVRLAHPSGRGASAAVESRQPALGRYPSRRRLPRRRLRLPLMPCGQHNGAGRLPRIGFQEQTLLNRHDRLVVAGIVLARLSGRPLPLRHSRRNGRRQRPRMHLLHGFPNYQPSAPGRIRPSVQTPLPIS